MIRTYKGQKTTAKFYFSGNKVRSDSINEGQPLSIIMLPDKNIVYTLLHKKKMFLKAEQDFDASVSGSPHSKYIDTMEFIQNETINGIPAKKYKDFDPNTYKKVFIWMTEFNNRPIKIEWPDDDMIIEYKNIRTNFPESVFSIPDGYEEYDPLKKLKELRDK